MLPFFSLKTNIKKSFEHAFSIRESRKNGVAKKRPQKIAELLVGDPEIEFSQLKSHFRSCSFAMFLIYLYRLKICPLFGGSAFLVFFFFRGRPKIFWRLGAPPQKTDSSNKGRVLLPFF